MPTLSWRVKKYLILQSERFRRWKALATSTKAADKRLADELRSTGDSPAMRDAKPNQESTSQFSRVKKHFILQLERLRRWKWAVWILWLVASAVVQLFFGEDDRSGLHVTREVEYFTVSGSRVADLSPEPESGNLEFPVT
jgi:hypothetical protein